MSIKIRCTNGARLHFPDTDFVVDDAMVERAFAAVQSGRFVICKDSMRHALQAALTEPAKVEQTEDQIRAEVIAEMRSAMAGLFQQLTGHKPPPRVPRMFRREPGGWGYDDERSGKERRQYQTDPCSHIGISTKWMRADGSAGGNRYSQRRRTTP